MLQLTMIFIEYFDMTKIIHTRNVQIVYNMKLRPCLQISGSRSEFLILDLDSWSLNTGSWTLDFETQILGPKFRVLSPRSWITDPTKCGHYYKVRGKIIKSCGSYYKVGKKVITKL